MRSSYEKQLCLRQRSCRGSQQDTERDRDREKRDRERERERAILCSSRCSGKGSLLEFEVDGNSENTNQEDDDDYEDYDDRWKEEDHNLFKEALEWLVKQPLGFMVAWSF